MFTNETKKCIFYEAIDMFSTVGYSEGTMRQLAERVGIKTASLYYYYPSKEHLLDDIFQHFLVNDKKYRSPVENIVNAAVAGLDTLAILRMMYVTHTNEDDFHIMNKIVKIAIGYQFEHQKAREVFNHIYYELALSSRCQVFSELIAQGIFAPFDYEMIAYAMTSFSMMRFMECMNRGIAVEDYTDYYNDGVRRNNVLLSSMIPRA